MSLKLRFVFDTNTIVSALLFDERNPRKSLQLALSCGELLLSTEVTDELAEILRRDKFDRYLKKKTREEFLRTLIQTATFIKVTDKIQSCRDPKDEKFLELAVSGNASQVISGDKDLLVLNPFRHISIVTPTQFLNFLIGSK